MKLKKSLSNGCHLFLLSLMTSCLPTLFLHMDTYSMTLIISSYIVIYCTCKFFREFIQIIGGQRKRILCSTSRTMSMGVVSNGTEAGGRMIDAKTACSSQLMSPKSLMTPLPRQVMADTYPKLSSS